MAAGFGVLNIRSASVTAMLAELETNYGVRTFAATAKARNYRSLALLRSLGFVPEPPAGVSQVEHGSDEIVMYKAVPLSGL